MKTSWEIEQLSRRNFRWRARRGDEVAEGEASSEGMAYIACDAALDEFFEAERREAHG